MRKVASLWPKICNRTCSRSLVRAATRMRLNRCPSPIFKRGNQLSKYFSNVPRFYSSQASTEEPSDSSVLDGAALQLWIFAAEPDSIVSNREGIEKCKETILSVAWKRHEHYRPALLLGVVSSLMESIEAKDEPAAQRAFAIAQQRLGTDLASQGYWSPAQKFLLSAFEKLGAEFHFDSCQILAEISLFGNHDLVAARKWLEEGLHRAPYSEPSLILLALTYALESGNPSVVNKTALVDQAIALLDKVEESVLAQTHVVHHSDPDWRPVYNASHGRLLSWCLIQKKNVHRANDIAEYCVHTFPEEADSYIALARAGLETGGPTKMIDAYELGLKNAESLELYSKYIVALIFLQGEYPKIPFPKLGVETLRIAQTKTQLLPAHLRRTELESLSSTGALSIFVKDQLALPFEPHWSYSFLSALIHLVNGDEAKAKLMLDQCLGPYASHNKERLTTLGRWREIQLRERFRDTLAFIKAENDED